MVQIFVNKQPVQLMQPFSANEEIISIKVVNFLHSVVGVPAGSAKPIAKWLYDLTQRATGTIVYNDTIIDKDSIKSPN